MSTSINFNHKALELFMEILPAITAIFDLGFIPMPEEIKEFDEETYALYEMKTGSAQRPLYTVTPSDDVLATDDVPVNDDASPKYHIKGVLLPENLAPLYKGIEFFEKYAASNNFPLHKRKQIFEHALEKAPDILKKGTKYESPQSVEPSGDVFGELMDFLADGLEKDDIFSFNVEDENGESFSKSFMPAYEKNVPSTVMAYDKFKAYVINALSQIFDGEKYKVEASMSIRPGEEQHEAIHVVTAEKGTWSNGFLVEPFYEEYKLGKPLGDIILAMVKSIEDNDEWINKVNIDDINAFETAKDSLFIRLLNYESNKSMLDGHIYKIIDDMAMVVYMFLSQTEAGMSSYKVPESAVKPWNLSEEYLFDWAIENTAKLFRPYIVPIETAGFKKSKAHVIPDKNRFFMDDNFALNKSVNNAYALFQEDGLNDSTVVFYKGAMQRLANILDDDLYIILPEVNFAVAHAVKQFPTKQLKKISKRVIGGADKAKSDMLSAKVYIYTRADDKISVFWD